MFLLIDKRPRIALSAVTLLLLMLVGGANISASPPEQATTPTPTAQPTKSILLTDPVPDPKQLGVQWFSPTGHTLRGAFLDYWNKYGGLAQFGYPLTEEFFEPVGADNKLYQVQYFERNRFEYHPENKGTQYEVLLGTLGLDFRKSDPPASPIADATYFKETGHNLSGKFKSYWDTHGGLFVHGYPITEAMREKSTNGKEYLVQWFERSRFELHPENAGSPYEVLLGLLGRQLSEKNGYPFGWYPLYGHAVDYSWFAGYYKADLRKCAPCGCSTVRYVSPSNTTYLGAAEVWPYLLDNRPSRQTLDVEGLRPTEEPETFIIVIGQLDDPNSITNSKPGGSCLSPKFKVTNLQFNPIH
jgi:hypothetical protein